MKKRYLVAAAAALIGGSLVIEMQAGSTGLEASTVSGSGGGMAAAMTARDGGGGETAGVMLYAARRRAVERDAKAAETARDAVIVSDEAVDGLSGGGGGMAGVLASDFDGLLVQTSGYDGAPLRLPVADAAGMIETSGFGGGPGLMGRNSLGGGNGEPLAVSAVPEPATWISLLVGMALVGYSLRQRTGPRSGPRSVSS